MNAPAAIRNAVDILSRNGNNLDTPKYAEYYKILNDADPDTLVTELARVPRPPVLKYGTVYQKLFGCHQRHYGSVTKGCSILCDGSAPTGCIHSTYTRDSSDGSLRMIRRGRDRTAYLFVDDDRTSLDPSEVTNLLAAGIDTVEIYRTEYNTHHLVNKLLIRTTSPSLGATD